MFSSRLMLFPTFLEKKFWRGGGGGGGCQIYLLLKNAPSFTVCSTFCFGTVSVTPLHLLVMEVVSPNSR